MALSQLIINANSLTALIEDPAKTHIGFVVKMNYETVDILTNDAWRERVAGLPLNSLLLACAFDPEHFDRSPEAERFTLLLRVVGPATIPQDSTTTEALIEHYQRQEQVLNDDPHDGIEKITHARLQFSGIRCNILGTFALGADGGLVLGSDVEDFQSVAKLRAYKPSAKVLQSVVNYVDPLRLTKARRDAEELGLPAPPAPIRVGSVRYTSANSMQRRAQLADVPVFVQPLDFLARRTAVFGMTRTGKSNTVKTMVGAVAMVAAKAQMPIGQLILDMNGEYANANNKDDGSSIAEAFEDNVVRYRGLEKPGFHDLRNNFYDSLESGLYTLRNALSLITGTSGQDMGVLRELSLTEPDPNEHSAHNRWAVKVAIYRALLKKADLAPSPRYNVLTFTVGADVFDALHGSIDCTQGCTNKATRVAHAKGAIGDPNAGVPIDDAITFLGTIRATDRALRQGGGQGIVSSGNVWLDEVQRGLLNLLVGRSDNETPIRSARVIGDVARPYHSPTGSDNVPADIYKYLREGRIVIVDLSVGDERVKETQSKDIARAILGRSMQTFTEGGTPPHIVIYVEEAHNLIGQDADFTDTWPRIAKEGAKFGIGLVYSTQEPSSMHRNILANTENFFVTHLNNDREIKAISEYYDFVDFAPSIKKVQDVGFARIKTLSSPYVLPVQVREFKPKELRTEYEALPKRQGFVAVKVPGTTASGSGPSANATGAP